jgi:hypothetical protein
MKSSSQTGKQVIPQSQIEVPPAPEIRGVDGKTRLPDHEIPAPQPAPATGKHPPPQAPKKKRKKPQGAGLTPPQAPLGERVLDLSEEVTPMPGEETHVDLATGLVRAAGREHRLSEAMVDAITKVSRFVDTEFSGGDRQRLRDEMQAAITMGRPPDAVFKHLIEPVIKLGKKRYAIINELLLLKEELPRLESGVAMAVLMGIIRS